MVVLVPVRWSRFSIWKLLAQKIQPVSKQLSNLTFKLFDRFVTNSISWSGSAIPLTTWSVAEIHSGIVAASIPALRTLFLCVATRLRSDPKLPNSSYESRNPYRYRVRKHDEDDDGTSTFPLHERSDAGNQGGIVKTTEFEVTNTTKQGVEVRPENTSGGGGPFASSTPEGSSLFVNSASDRV